MKIAVLITCHNRKAKTIACLEGLFQNELPTACSVEVFLVDDGSTDGTEQAVRDRYPQITIISGDGNLYWNGGMRVAFAVAMERCFDYYLWLNDDMLLYPITIETLIITSHDLQAKQGKSVIVVGSAQDANDGRFTYGGVKRLHKWKATKFTPVEPHDEPVECETMNGNCVLIPSEIAQTVGNMESKFVHSMGDMDYGLRAHYAGFSIWLMPGFAGTCSRNDEFGTFKDTSLPATVRLRKLMQPKVLPPSSWLVFTQRHTGLLWPIFWLWPYAKVLLNGLVKK